MKTLITNVYSYKNKGDAAIVVALVSEVRRAFPEVEILIQTTDLKHDLDKYDAPISASLLWLILSSVRGRHFIVRLGKLISGIGGLGLYLLAARHFKKRLSWLLSDELNKFVKEIDDHDFVIACGGGYLRTADGRANGTILLIVTCLNFAAGYYLGRPVYLYSQSIGPVHGWLQKRILKASLNRVNLIESREDITTKFLKELGSKTPVIETADPVFLLQGMGRTAPVTLRPASLRVGITVRKWFSDDARLNQYIIAMAQMIDYLISEHDAQVYYIPQVIAANFGDDDRVIAERVQRFVKQNDRFELLTQDLHPLELVGICGQMDIFIGTRMHSNIFALINTVPVVAIEYEHKTRGIMRGLGLEELTIRIEDVEPEELKRRVDELLKNKAHYRKMIAAGLVKETSRSRSAIEAIRQDITAHAK